MQAERQAEQDRKLQEEAAAKEAQEAAAGDQPIAEGAAAADETPQVRTSPGGAHQGGIAWG